LAKALATNYVPFHFDVIGLGADVDVDLGFCGGEVGRWGEMGLLMLFFYCMIGGAAIDIFAMDTNAHVDFEFWILDFEFNPSSYGVD
jgi:hypothetical protein